jgi:hypothetical protein
MRIVSLILCTVLIQMGLLGRALAIVPCCPESHSDHRDHHSHDDCDGEGDEGPGETRNDGGHDHHHTSCVHNLLIPIVADARHGLTPPDAESIKHPRHHQWPPDKPFLALEKPPLI